MSYLEDASSIDRGTEDLQSVIKRLEEVHLNSPPSSKKYSSEVPTRIRDIITKSISPKNYNKDETNSLIEENQHLQIELNRVEEKLTSVRTDREEFNFSNVKKLPGNNTVMDSPSHMLLDASTSSYPDVNNQQITLLKQKLDDEHSNYRRKLQAYQDGQQRQAQLIQKLQNKVLQYKKKNTEQDATLDEKNMIIEKLESELRKTNSLLQTYEKQFKDNAENEESNNLENSLIHLEEERQRNASLQHVNNMLRDQLEQATSSNNNLTMELEKVSGELQKHFEELEHREEEEELYFTEEHKKILKMWTSINMFRKSFSKLKLETQKDLSIVKADVNRSARAIQSATQSIENTQRNSVNQNVLQEEQGRREKAESLLREKIQEALELRSLCEKYKDQMEEHANEETKQLKEIAVKFESKTAEVESLKMKLQAMGVEQAELSEKWEVDSHLGINAAREDAELYRQTLQELTNLILDDSESTAYSLGVDNKIDRDFFDDPDGNDETDNTFLFTTNTGPSRNSKNLQHSKSQVHKSRMRSLSPTRARSPAVPDAALSAARSSLKKRQLQVQELKSKYDLLYKEHTSSKKELKEKNNQTRVLQDEVNQIKDNHHCLESNLEGALQEVSKYKQMLELLQNEKHGVERSKQTLFVQVEEYQTEVEKLKVVTLEMNQQLEEAEEKRESISKENTQLIKESNQLKAVMQQLQGNETSLKEKFVNLNEKLNRANLSNEVLEQEKQHLNELFTKFESQKIEMEMEIHKFRSDDVQLKDALVKLQSLNEALGQDKVELNKMIRQIELERESLLNEKQEMDMEKSSIKEELLQTERDRIELETEKNTLTQSLQLSNSVKDQMQKQIQDMLKNKTSINDSLNMTNREKDNLHNDLMQCQQESTRQAANLQRLSKEKEELTREKAHLVVQLNGGERDHRVLLESNASLKADKESLESSLFELQQIVAKLEGRKVQLETENHQVILTKETLAVDLARVKKEKEIECMKLVKDIELLEQQMSQCKRDHEVAINRAKQYHEEELQRLSIDNEKIKVSLTKDHNTVRDELHDELEKSNKKAERERNMLVNEVALVQKERDDLLLQAETERQEELRIMVNKNAALQEKFNTQQHEFEADKKEFEKFKQDSAKRTSQDRVLINSTQQELKAVQDSLDDSIAGYKNQIQQLNTSISEIVRNKEVLMKESNDIKLQLKLTLESRDTIQQECKQLQHQTQETREGLDTSQKECMELKMLLKEVEREKEVSLTNSNELRELVKLTESEKSACKVDLDNTNKMMAQLEESSLSQLKETDELRTNIQELEVARQDARREIQQLHNQLRSLENECLKYKKELTSLKDQLSKSERLIEEGRRDTVNSKQRLAESELSIASAKRDNEQLNNKLVDLMEDVRVRAKDYQMSVDDARRNEMKSVEKVKSLENLLDNLTQEKSDLKLKLSSAEGRNAGLENQLTKFESSKNETDYKLNNVYSTLRRTLGIRLTSSVSQPVDNVGTPSPNKSLSPKRRTPFGRNRSQATPSYDADLNSSPNNDLDSSGNISTSDVDPEYIRTSLRDIARKLKDLERERDEGIVKIKGLERQLAGLEDDRNECEVRVETLQKHLQDTEEGKRGVDGRLSSAQTALMLQEETIRRLERERKLLNEKLQTLETGQTQAEADKRSLKEKLSKLVKNETRWENEREAMRSQIDNAESRITRIDMKKRNLEGDMERLRIQYQDSENERQSLKQRVDDLAREKQNLQQSTSSLHSTVERLNSTLLKSGEQERVFKEKVTELSVSLTENNSSSQLLQDKLQQIQRALAASEHERETLQENLDTLKQQYQDSERMVESQTDKIQTLKETMAESESKRLDIDNQLRLTQVAMQKKQGSEGEVLEKNTRLQQEKRVLQDRLAQLQRVLSQTEQEKREMERNVIRIEKEKKSFKMAVDKMDYEKLMVEEELHRARSEKSDLDQSLSATENESNELRSQISLLQQAFDEKEQQLSKKVSDINARHREEIDRENDRSRNSQLHLERTHAARERAHKQRVRGLEEQVNTLKEQLAKEMQQKQSFITRTVQKNDEMRDLRQKLSSSLTEVSKNAASDILERESHRLDETVDHHHSFANRTTVTTSTPYARRPKSASPVTKLAPDKYQTGLSMTPTTDPGLTSTRHATPLTTDIKKVIAPSYVSPIRKTRKQR